MGDIYEEFKWVPHVLFGVGFLWLLRKAIGNTAIETLKVLFLEFRQINQVRTERGAVNLVGGIIIGCGVFSLLIFNNLDKLLKIVNYSSAAPHNEKTAHAIVMVVFVGAFFLVCTAMVKEPSQLK